MKVTLKEMKSIPQEKVLLYQHEGIDSCKINPFLHDGVNMGQHIGAGLLLMYGNFSTEKCRYLILVDETTGERVRIIID
jgi:hypothetical protein